MSQWRRDRDLRKQIARDKEREFARRPDDRRLSEGQIGVFGDSRHVTVIGNGEAIDDSHHNRRKLLQAKQRLIDKGVNFSPTTHTDAKEI